MRHFKAIAELKLELQSGKAWLGSKSAFFIQCDLEIWQTTLKNDRAPLLCYLKICESFHCHLCIQIGVIVRKRQFGSKSGIFCPMRPWNLTNDLEKQKDNSSYYLKICASFHCHLWIQTGVAVQKRPIWVEIGNFLSHATLKFDEWPSSMLLSALCIIS